MSSSHGTPEIAGSPILFHQVIKGFRLCLACFSCHPGSYSFHGQRCTYTLKPVKTDEIVSKLFPLQEVSFIASFSPSMSANSRKGWAMFSLVKQTERKQGGNDTRVESKDNARQPGLCH